MFDGKGQPTAPAAAGKNLIRTTSPFSAKGIASQSNGLRDQSTMVPQGFQVTRWLAAPVHVHESGRKGGRACAWQACR